LANAPLPTTKTEEKTKEYHFSLLIDFSDSFFKSVRSPEKKMSNLIEKKLSQEMNKP
jgi:hypothetical protein